MWFQPFINNLFHEILISLSYMYLLYGSQLLLPDYYMLLSVLFAHLQVCEYFCVALFFFSPFLFLPEGVHPFFRRWIVYMTISNSTSTWVATCCLRGLTWLACAMFSCVQIMVWLPVLGIFSLRRCWCRRLQPGAPRTPWESLRWKLTLGEKSLAALGSWTCVSGLLVPTPSQLSYIPALPPPPPHTHTHQSLNL